MTGRQRKYGEKNEVMTEEMKKIRKNIRGSLTVEAAFIMPMVIFIVFAIMYLTWYLHDTCRIRAAVDKTLHKAMMSVKHETNISTGETDYVNINSRGVFYLPFGSTRPDEDRILKNLNNELKDGLFLIRISNTEVSVDKFNIYITVEADAAVSVKGGASFLKPNLKIKVQEKGQIHNPAEMLRLSEVVLDTASKIKGVEELKEKLDQFLN